MNPHRRSLRKRLPLSSEHHECSETYKKPKYSADAAQIPGEDNDLYKIPRHTDIYDFPTETLEEIFLHVVSPSQDHSSLGSSTTAVSSYCSSTSPLLFSKICKSWRDIAFRSPSLWTHLHVVDPGTTGIVHYLKEWINRAGSLPLCLYLCEYYRNLKASKAVVALFLNSIHRCKSFEMILRIPLEHFGVKKLRMLPSTSLESVKVRCKDSRFDDGEILANLLLRTRTIRTIRWLAALGPLGTISQYWENLRELYIQCGGSSLSEFLNALARCQNLESLVLREHFTNDSPGAKSVTLPRLTHLSVLVGWSTKIMSLLFLPSLAELEVMTFGTLELDPVLDLMQRSGVTLRRFGIVDEDTFSGVTHGGHMELLRVLKFPYFRALKILEVGVPMTGHEIIGFLTLTANRGVGGENEGPGDYLVYLEKISLMFGNTAAVEVSLALRKLIKSRLGTQHAIKVVGEYIEIKKRRYQSEPDIIFTLSIPT